MDIGDAQRGCGTAIDATAVGQRRAVEKPLIVQRCTGGCYCENRIASQQRGEARWLTGNLHGVLHNQRGDRTGGRAIVVSNDDEIGAAIVCLGIGDVKRCRGSARQICAV